MHTKLKTLMYLWVGGRTVSKSIEKNVSRHCSEEPRVIKCVESYVRSPQSNICSGIGSSLQISNILIFLGIIMKINYLGNVLNQSNIVINYLVHSLSTHR